MSATPFDLLRPAAAARQVMARPPVYRSAIFGRPEPGEGERQTAGELMATSAGAPLPSIARRSLERAFGMDLSAVRLHTGAVARRASDLLGARALAQGSDVFLPDGVSERAAGPELSLLAHEVSHVAQHQGRPLDVARMPLTLAHRSSAEERQADEIERSVEAAARMAPSVAASGLPMARMAAPAAVQRVDAPTSAPSGASAPGSGAPAEAAPATEAADPAELAERVYALIERRLEVERERIGIRW